MGYVIPVAQSIAETKYKNRYEKAIVLSGTGEQILQSAKERRLLAKRGALMHGH